MEKYLNYLLADIAAAADGVPVLTHEDSDEGPSFIPVDEEEKMARRERLGDWIGLRQEWFPPASRLGEEQMARILEAMNQCLDAYNFIPHFPSGLPLKKRYEVLVAYLNKEVPILSHNPWQIDFCDYEPRSCPFGESFCQCKVYEHWLTQMDDEEEEEESMADRPLIPDFFFGDEEEDYDDDDDEDFYFDDEEGFDDEEFDFGEEWEDEDDDGLFFSGLSDFEPGPDDDDGRWN